MTMMCQNILVPGLKRITLATINGIIHICFRSIWLLVFVIKIVRIPWGTHKLQTIFNNTYREQSGIIEQTHSKPMNVIQITLLYSAFSGNLHGIWKRMKQLWTLVSIVQYGLYFMVVWSYSAIAPRKGDHVLVNAFDLIHLADSTRIRVSSS